ncbi:Ran-specific GTPase-activating protein [Cichlidogyrus casuarinus]|uniref:Ran-specific GTPase-activating protein n=1 Tax=Cichlidogyrus casuarinus TaxID=1844966 RepID=A0ABD2QB93_9PLAT
MRRDKLCANHVLYPGMKLIDYEKAKNTFVWCTPCDYSENEISCEVFAIKFDNHADAEEFKNQIHHCLDSLINSKSDHPASCDGDEKAQADKSINSSKYTSVYDDSTDANLTDKLSRITVSEAKISADSVSA